MPATRPAFLHQLPLRERLEIRRALHDETVGGVLLLVAAVAAILWANLLPESYDSLRGATVGPKSLHLDLSLQQWAADGLLAVFFFVAGLELKREVVVGELRDPSEAVLPVAAAVAGMVGPALVFVAVALASGDPSALRGWATPTATDIAFALAVLAVVGSALPVALRAFLLTLAVVDDLGAIAIIAIFFTSELHLAPLTGAVALLVVYALLQRHRVTARWIYAPLALAVWALMHESGVHATVAGVAIGLLTRVRRDRGEHESPAERLEHRFRPYSAGICVPLFALLAAGVTVSIDALGRTFTDAAALGVIAGLVIGKTMGVFLGTWATARFTRAELNPGLGWLDILGVGALSGIGFTVALLIGDLAFGADPERVEQVKAAVLIGSLVAAVFAGVLLRVRNAKYRTLREAEDRDDDADGIPDVYQPARHEL